MQVRLPVGGPVRRPEATASFLRLSTLRSLRDLRSVTEKTDFENPAPGAGAKLIAPIYKGGELKTQVKIRISKCYTTTGTGMTMAKSSGGPW